MDVDCICFIFSCNLSLGADFYDPPSSPSPPPTSYYIMKKKQDMDVADRPAMFYLTACLAPAFCFLFRMVLSIVKRHSLISRRLLWMSFVSAHVPLTSCLAPAFCFLFRMVLSIVKRPSLISVLWMSFLSAYVCCCLIHTCQPLVLLHSLPRRPFPLLISYGIIYSQVSSGIIYVIA